MKQLPTLPEAAVRAGWRVVRIVDMPEAEHRWRRQQLLKVLAEILRNPDPPEPL